MNESIRRRHLPPGTAWRSLWAEEFDHVTIAHVPGWRKVGSPTLQPIRLDGRRGVELRGPADLQGVCGIERDLDTRLLAGRDVCLEIWFTCRSVLRLEALRGVRIVMTAADRSGRRWEVDCSVRSGVAPGWERDIQVLRFGHDLDRITLRILAEKPGAILTLDRIGLLVAGSDAGPASSSPRPAFANRVIDGSFETGARRFFASRICRWPNGDERVAPLAWWWTDAAAVGRHALAFDLSDGTARIGFGPLDLSLPPAQKASWDRVYYLSFYARSERPARVVARLRTERHLLDSLSFEVGPIWQRCLGAFDMSAEGGTAPASAELLLDFAGEQEGPTNRCEIDAVVLQARRLTEQRFTPSAPLEVGLEGPAENPADMSNLVDRASPVRFVLRAVTYRSRQVPAATPATRPSGGHPPGKVYQLVVDVLDGWDRLVVRHTRKLEIPPEGLVKQPFELGPLPEGFYRVLATVWTGTPGDSQIVSQDRLSLAILALNRPVPSGNYFGLTSVDGTVSQWTTHLGAGWVRLGVSARKLLGGDARDDVDFWRVLADRVSAAGVELVVDVDLPADAAQRTRLLSMLLSDAGLRLFGLVARPPAVAARPAARYGDCLEEVAADIAARAPGVRLARDLSATPGLPDPDPPVAEPPDRLVWALRSASDAIPEYRESFFEAIGRRRSSLRPVWELQACAELGDVGPPGRTGGPVRVNPLASRSARAVVEHLGRPVDPARSASRAVRAMLIRGLAGASMVCSEAEALHPLRSLDDGLPRRLHGADFSPRPAVAAFHTAACLLNDATLVRWVDVPGGSRVVYYEKDDGGAVAVLWRPFGLSPTRLSFPDLPSSARLLDCFGTPVRWSSVDGIPVIPVNEMVRFLVVSADQRETLRRCLDHVGVLLEPPAS